MSQRVKHGYSMSLKMIGALFFIKEELVKLFIGKIRKNRSLLCSKDGFETQKGNDPRLGHL